MLVAITDRPEPGVILTQRTDTMRRHAGQVAFPGGRIDPEDADAAAAALREAEEEIALPRDAVEVIGAADLYLTVTGYSVTPVIGVIAPDLDYHPNEAEVADVFEVPLALRARSRRIRSRSAPSGRAARAPITRSTGATAASGARPRR